MEKGKCLELIWIWIWKEGQFCFLNDCILWQICLQNWQKNNISGINFSEKCLGSDWVLRNSLWRGIPTYMRPVVPLWKNSLVNNKDKLQYKVLGGIGLDRWRGYAKSNIVNVVILFKQLWKIKMLKTSIFSKILRWSIWNPNTFGKTKSIKFSCSRQMSHCGWNSNAPEFLSDHTHLVSFITDGSFSRRVDRHSN